MKNVTRAVIASAVILSVGVAVLPSITLAASGNRPSSSMRHERPDRDRAGGMMGDITAINANSDGTGTITVTTVKPMPGRPGHDFRDDGRADRALPVPGSSVTITYNADTVFMIKGDEGSVANLAVGDRIRFNGAQKDGEILPVRRITTDLQPMRAHRGIMGTVTAVDTGANTLTILSTAHKNHDARTITVQYSESTTFGDDGDAATESDVHVGDSVHVVGKITTSGNSVAITDVRHIEMK